MSGSVGAGTPVGDEFVTAAVAALRHRGPDAQGTAAVEAGGLQVRLGHDRLSIIDLSAAGNQPMSLGDRFTVVYNGELYNYREVRRELEGLGHSFTSTSDTGVMLVAWREWGRGAITRFNGMFAYALVDRLEGALWLVRDRFGVKPLYWGKDARGVIHFASTADVVARALGAPPDLSYVARGIHYWLYEDDTALSPFVGVQAVPPGHALRITPAAGGGLQVGVEPYYDLEDGVAATSDRVARIPLSQAIDEIRALLADAVALRLRADVPVAVSLSGGLDSTSVAVLAEQIAPGLRGFTFGDPDDPASEGPIVARFAKDARIDVEFIHPRAGRTVVEAFAAGLAAQGSPIVGPGIVAQYSVYQAVQRAGFKVLLGGQGGDEAFMGYNKFRVFRLQRLLAQRDLFRALSHLVLELPAWLVNRPSLRMFLRQRARYRAHGGVDLLPGFPAPAPLELGYDPRTPLQSRQLLDVTRLSLPTLLRYEDRNSMACSVESRLPYLDYRLVELGIALPDALKLRGGWTKWVLREAMRGRLPDTVRASRLKRAFDVRVPEIVAAGLGQLVRGGLSERFGAVSQWLGTRGAMLERYSDHQLATDPAVMAEAMNMYWLAART